MKKINGNAVGYTVFVFLFLYLVFAFIYLDWQPMNWRWSGILIYFSLSGYILNFGLSDGRDD